MVNCHFKHKPGGCKWTDAQRKARAAGRIDEVRTAMVDHLESAARNMAALQKMAPKLPALYLGQMLDDWNWLGDTMLKQLRQLDKYKRAKPCS